MMIMFILFAGAAALELLVHVASKFSGVRTGLATLSLAVTAGATAAALALHFNLFTVLLALLAGYRILNMLRVIEKRMHDRYLKNATRSTTFTLLGLQSAVGLGWLAWSNWHTTGHATWAILGLLQLAASGVFLYSVLRTLRRTAWPTEHGSYSDAELPSVTVAIPARNETEDLQQCLQSIIASDYPKLEVIVLDDCSQTKRTPEIIREFAHDGVRFIQGHQPDETWLPKNEAYARLAQEASGAYVLFCGVDIRFSQSSIRTLVSTMLDRKKQMVSILPRRRQEAYGQVSLVQAMRYWWELVPPRRAFQRPPVLSSCWIIDREVLKKRGGFASVARAIVPEAYFARQLTANDAYSFLRSDGVGIESIKSVNDQRSTAIRMRYPQMHRRPEQIAITTLWELLFLVMPFVLAVGGFWLPIGTVAHLAAALASLMLIGAYEATVLSTRVNSWWFGIIGQPLAALSDVVLLHYSMWKYEFSTVDWKGRNVCVPVMHVTPHLPPVDGKPNK
ncbi:MAG TPA: glycosyltransferase family 2 protein [Candidatus Saccharimonadales bacterium]|nr:glycosyltransferase family 2 protein [Candidatus Saccharimonadales bacterium]